jgi:hypothetical protein
MHSEYKTTRRKKEIGLEGKLLKSKIYCPYNRPPLQKKEKTNKRQNKFKK